MAVSPLSLCVWSRLAVELCLESPCRDADRGGVLDEVEFCRDGVGAETEFFRESPAEEFCLDGVREGGSGGRSGRGLDVGLPCAGDGARGAVEVYLRSAAGTGCSLSHVRSLSSLDDACSPGVYR